MSRIAIAVLCIMSIGVAPAQAKGTDHDHVHAAAGAYLVQGTEGSTAATSHSASGATQTSQSDQPPVIYYSCTGHALCDSRTCAAGQTKEIQRIVLGNGNDEFNIICLGNSAVTAATVLRAFRRIPVPTPALHIEPVKGRTLVNFKTNFYATGGTTFTKTITLLGQRVTLRIHVDHYDFHFDDGTHLTTTTPGAGYPHLTNTHEYLHKGTLHPHLTTTWAADYKIGNTTWQTVTGTVTKNTAPQRLQVLTATPLLTSPSH